MGSGKGQVKRTKTYIKEINVSADQLEDLVPEASKLLFDTEYERLKDTGNPYVMFVVSRGIEDITFAGYYLQEKHEYNNDELEFVSTEFLRDVIDNKLVIRTAGGVYSRLSEEQEDALDQLNSHDFEIKIKNDKEVKGMYSISLRYQDKIMCEGFVDGEMYNGAMVSHMGGVNRSGYFRDDDIPAVVGDLLLSTLNGLSTRTTFAE